MFLIVVLFSFTANAAVVVTSPTTIKVAPQSIFFDASQTTCEGFDNCTNPLQDLEFEWNFGDEPAATWPTDGKSKNKAFGSVANHDYYTPGTFQATVTVRDRNSHSVTQNAPLVTMQDPKTVFSANQTRCWSNTAGTFQGCPNDTNNDGTCDVATNNCQVVSPTTQVFLHTLPNEKQWWMFHAGDSFLLGSGRNYSGASAAGPNQITFFGTGARPVVYKPDGNIFAVSTPPILDIAVVGIEWKRDNISPFGPVIQWNGLRRVFIGDNKFEAGDAPILFDGCTLANCSEVSISNNVSRNQRDNWFIIGTGIHMNASGNDIDMPVPPTAQSHAVRYGGVKNFTFEHNRVKAQNKFNLLAIRASGFSPALSSDHIVISDNKFENNGWLINGQSGQSIGITGVSNLLNDISQGNIENCLIERNVLQTSKLHIFNNCGHSTIRSNIIDMSGTATPLVASNPFGILVDDEPTTTSHQLAAAQGSPITTGLQDVRIYNNTLFCSGCVVSPLAGTLNGLASGITFHGFIDSGFSRNNIMMTYSGPAIIELRNESAILSGITSDHNFSTEKGTLPVPPFVVNPPNSNDPNTIVPGYCGVENGGPTAGGSTTGLGQFRDFFERAWRVPMDAGAATRQGPL